MNAGEPGLLDLVTRCVQRVLAEPGTVIGPGTSLLDLRGFTSLAIVDLVGQLEAESGVRLEPEQILPETFETPLAIAAVLASAGAA